MADRHVKRCSTAVIIREMPIKILIRYHFTLVRMTVIKNKTNNKYNEDVEKREPLCTINGNGK